MRSILKDGRLDNLFIYNLICYNNPMKTNKAFTLIEA